jgi:hypothetical protein
LFPYLRVGNVGHAEIGEQANLDSSCGQRRPRRAHVKYDAIRRCVPECSRPIRSTDASASRAVRGKRPTSDAECDGRRDVRAQSTRSKLMQSPGVSEYITGGPFFEYVTDEQRSLRQAGSLRAPHSFNGTARVNLHAMSSRFHPTVEGTLLGSAPEFDVTCTEIGRSDASTQRAQARADFQADDAC